MLPDIAKVTSRCGYIQAHPDHMGAPNAITRILTQEMLEAQS